MKRVVIIDNYDSFTYNLVQAVAVLPGEPAVEVLRNDAVGGSDLEKLRPSHLIISPGPCTPQKAHNSNEIIRFWAGKIPILGVCLGHQCIAEVFGGKVVRAQCCMHGKTSLIYHDCRGVFAGLSNPFQAMRYHSLVIDTAGLDSDFVITARTSPTLPADQQEIMGIRNQQLNIEGLQFHPESFATNQGPQILENFLSL